MTGYFCVWLWVLQAAILLRLSQGEAEDEVAGGVAYGAVENSRWRAWREPFATSFHPYMGG